MRALRRPALALLAASFLAPRSIFACTSFLIKTPEGPVMAKNLDWRQEDGMVVVNKRNVLKRSFTVFGGDKSSSWVSRYGSVTFNQAGREMPLGGMNEAGLMIEVLWLDDTKYPKKDSRPALGLFQWIQYQLDNHATVAEVARDADRVRVEDFPLPLHYFACDKTGDCASFEYLGGRLSIHAGSDLPVQVLANDAYAKSIKYLKSVAGFGGDRPVPAGTASMERFARAAAEVKAFAGTTSAYAVDRAFDILDDVRQDVSDDDDTTKWQIVYEPAAGKLHFRTTAETTLRTIDAAGLDYSCSTPVKTLDVDAASVAFSGYDPRANRKLAAKSLAAAFGIPRIIAAPLVYLTSIASYPETTRCLDASAALSRAPEAAALSGLSRISGAAWPSR